jgi:phospholipid/cholesterol/gamma-HCH transport system substrate-binding protein
MRPKERSAIAFLAAAAALAALGVAGPGRRGDLAGLWRDDRVIYAAARDAYGTAPGAEVLVHGVPVGEVTRVELVRDGARPDRPVRLTLRISAHGASFLRGRTLARIERAQFGAGIPPFATPPIALVPEGGEPLPPGAVIDAEGTETLVESFAELTREMAALRAHFDDLRGLFADAGAIAGAIARGEGAASRLLFDPKTAGELDALLRDARATAGDTRRLVADARGLAARAPAVLDGLAGTSDEGRRILARLDRAADALPRLLAEAERTLAITEELAKELRKASSFAPELVRKLDASIEEANRAVDAAERSLLLRGTLPDRPIPRSEAEVRPPAPLETAPLGTP